MTRNQIIIIGIVGIIILFFVLVFLGVIPGLKPALKNPGQGGPQTQLSFWGVEDEPAMRPIFETYQARGAKINYTQFNESNFEKSLIDALASGKGPDIFAFHNTWLGKHPGKVVSIPTAKNFTINQLKNLFPKIIESDFSKNGQIYALPIYIDTLAFIYNRDFFDAKGIALTPKSWSEFQNIIPNLKEIDGLGRLAKAATAIGGSERSVNKAVDLLNLTMLQFGAAMNEGDSGDVDFSGKEAVQALNFYLQFSDQNSQSYTWNDNLRYSLDNFSQGGVAAVFNYSRAIPLIKAKNPFLNFQISPMLQFSQDNIVNYADYWGLAVSNQSKQQSAAWDFILYLSVNQAVAEQYLLASKKPPALRSLIQKYINDSNLGVFSQQALTAKSWRQKDNEAIKKIFSNMIESILSGRLSSEKALQQAENEINGL